MHRWPEKNNCENNGVRIDNNAVNRGYNVCLTAHSEKHFDWTNS